LAVKKFTLPINPEELNLENTEIAKLSAVVYLNQLWLNLSQELQAKA
jgi:hypothetical protein